MEDESTWAVSEEVADEAGAALQAELTRAESEERADAMRIADELAGIDPAVADALDTTPTEIDRRSPAEKYTPNEPNDAQVQGKGASGVDPDTIQIVQAAKNHVLDGELDRVNDALIEAGLDHSAEELQQALAKAAPLYEAFHPEASEQFETAEYLATKRLATGYVQGGMSQEQAYTKAAFDVRNALWAHVSRAVQYGRNPAEALHQAALAELALQNPNAAQGSAAQGRGAATAATVTRGQRAAARKAPDQRPAALSEYELSQKYHDLSPDEWDEEFERAHGLRESWLPR